MIATPNWNYAPPWANYVAQDEDGVWNWFSDKPISSPSTGEWVHIDTKDSFEVWRKEPIMPVHATNWIETLTARPTL